MLAGLVAAGDVLSAGSVTHVAKPYVYKPDPQVPDASVPAEVEIADTYEARRARRAQQIIRRRCREVLTLYGVNVGSEARCVNGDPGDAN